MTNATAFDFDALDYTTACEQPFEFELKHPVSGDGLGVFLAVIGAESGTFQQFVRAEGNAARKRAYEKRRAGKGDEPMPIEDEEAMLLSALATCLRGWRTGDKPVIVWGKREIAFSRDEAMAWLRQFKWIREQINEATGDLGNFIGSGSKAS